MSDRSETLARELADTKKHLNYYMGRTAQAEAKLARVVEAADALQREVINRGGEYSAALAAAKGE